MVIPQGTDLPMPRPYGGEPPVITRTPKGDGQPGDLITVQFVGEIGPLSQYLELLTVLDTATENDEIDIRLDTPGGEVYTAIAIVERMEHCKANVITTASGIVASAGTFIWFYGKERRVNRWARFLFHCSSHGDMGRTLSIYETSEKMVKYMKELGLQMLGAGIITRAEYVAAFENKADVELSARVIRARLGLKAEAAPAEPAPAEPAPAPAAPAEPAPAPAEPAPAPAAPAEPAPAGKCKCVKVRVVKADGTTEIVEGEPVPAEPAPAPAPAPAAPAEPAPAAAPEEPVVDIAKIFADAGVEMPAEPAAPAEPAPAPAPAEPAPAPAAPAPAPAAPAARR